MSRVQAHLGDIARHKGTENEERVVKAIEDLDVPWIERVRKGTENEDRRGIDVVVTTDVGDLYLQVKSSKKGAASFGWRRNVRVVVAKPRHTLKERTLRTLENMRTFYLEKRNG